jgi:hypothetical protein
MRYVPRWYKENESRIYLVVRQSPASKKVKTEAKEDVTRRQQVKV